MISNRLLLCILFLVVLQPTSSVVGMQKSGAQTVKGPSVVVIGVVSGTSALVRVDKLTANARTLPNGDRIAELPKPSEYYLGTIYQVRVNEIIKGNKRIRLGQTITILIPGPANVSDRVTLSSGRKYLLKLLPLDEDIEKYKGTAVMDLTHPSAVKRQFDPRDVFTVAGELDNAVPITEGNRELIERIRREARSR